MKQGVYRAIIFGSLLLIFLATAALVILSLAGFVDIESSYKNLLVSVLIVEVIGAIFTFWKQLNTSFPDPPDISGEWEYECVRNDANYKHGGFCSITKDRTKFGWEFTIHGKRTWMATKKDGDWQKTTLEAPYSWDSIWGAFCSNDELRYFYSVSSSGTVNQGYGDLNITQYQNKKPSVLEGNFGLLPPSESFYGSERYVRIDKRPVLNVQ